MVAAVLEHTAELICSFRGEYVEGLTGWVRAFCCSCAIKETYVSPCVYCVCGAGTQHQVQQ